MENKEKLLGLAQSLREMASSIELSLGVPNIFYSGGNKYSLDELCDALIDLKSDIRWNGITPLEKMLEEI